MPPEAAAAVAALAARQAALPHPDRAGRYIAMRAWVRSLTRGEAPGAPVVPVTG